MKEIYYEFLDLDSDESFLEFGKAFGGVFKNHVLYFNNQTARGELVKISPESGLWIRKWKLTVLQKITLHKTPGSFPSQKKFFLIYFLNPSIFNLHHKRKKISIRPSSNNMFFTSNTAVDFSVIPKQPFYVLDIAFTESWLSAQLNDASLCTGRLIDQHLKEEVNQILTKSCDNNEYKIIRELETALNSGNNDILFIRSRVYNLIIFFLIKLLNRHEMKLSKTNVSYEEIVTAEELIRANLEEPKSVENIAREVNMSTSSLIRQFKFMYGKNVYEYYIGKKMESAKQLILEKKITIKEIAKKLGYKQSSSFIEAFIKHYGFTPGSLKLMKK